MAGPGWLWMVLTLHICLLCFLQGSASLRMIRLTVPPVMLRGESAMLHCQYDMETDRLYSVSWYKDHEEIYRFVPKTSPPQHSYRVEGVRIEHHQSDAQRLTLRNVNLKSSGVYRCEVSAEGPVFRSVHGEGRMEVIALPKENPEITGLEQGYYQIGDILNVNCTSDRSYPPAKLRWFINNRQVGSANESHIPSHGLVKSVAGLMLRVGPQHFEEGRMALRCVATVHASHHWVSQGREQRADPLPRVATPTEFDNREAHKLVRSGCDRVLSAKMVLLSLAIVFFAS